MDRGERWRLRCNARSQDTADFPGTVSPCGYGSRRGLRFSSKQVAKQEKQMFVVFLAPPRKGGEGAQVRCGKTTSVCACVRVCSHCRVSGVLGFTRPTLKHFPARGIKVSFECVTAICLIQSVPHRPQSVTARLRQ